jgi:hypothetical protein
MALLGEEGDLESGFLSIVAQVEALGGGLPSL